MEKRIFIILLVLCGQILGVKGQGIRFENFRNWDQVLIQAKQEHKYIFVDCFTTWCGPCKEMDQKTYPNLKAGEYFNAHFISVKLQMDSTVADDEQVKARHPVAKQFARYYKIVAYPSFFFSPDGRLVHEAVGYQAPDSLIARGEEALDSSKQFLTMMEKYKNHRLDNSIVPVLITKVEPINKKLADSIAQDYLNNYVFKVGLSDQLSRQNISLIYRYTHATENKGFQILIQNKVKIDSVVGNGNAERKIVWLILKTKLAPSVNNLHYTPGEWDSLENKYSEEHAVFGKVAVLEQRLISDDKNQDWIDFAVIYYRLFKKPGSMPGVGLEINNISWEVFTHINDHRTLDCAIRTMAQHKEEDPESMNTYADLLYKRGRTSEGIKWADNAVSMEQTRASQQQRQPNSDYQADLDKMKKGEQNW